MTPQLPSALFAQKAAELNFVSDQQQIAALGHYDKLWQVLEDEKLSTAKSFWQGLLKSRGAIDIKGLYFWGGVGRGKTMLMDVFYQSVLDTPKMRMHYHEFMQMVHGELGKLKDAKDTLRIVARNLAPKCRLLCLDEFHVNDIGDAMILGNLLQALFANRVILVTTSNRVPSDLYCDGLQRERFLPAIDLLHQHCQIIELDNQQDYRQFGILGKTCFYQPHSEAIDAELGKLFAKLSGQNPVASSIQINGRPMATRAQAGAVIWFDFAQLCEQPSAQSDYLAIAQQFETVILSAIPTMDNDKNDAARRFLNVLDVFYDQKRRLVVSAYNPVNQLYRGHALAFEFDRATSRLLEMQTEEYLAQFESPNN